MERAAPIRSVRKESQDADASSLFDCLSTYIVLACPVVHVFVLIAASASLTQVCRWPAEGGRAAGCHQGAESQHPSETAPRPGLFHGGPPAAGGAGGAGQSGAGRPCQQWHLVAHRLHEQAP